MAPVEVGDVGEVGPAPVYRPDAVTPCWLGQVLRYAGVIDDGADVVAATAEQIGTGQVGANIRFRLQYEPANAAGPASVVAKFAAADETSRAAGIATRTYETEVAFYRELAHTVEVSRPACYLAAITPGTADVVLVLEDVAPATQGDQIAGCDVAQAELAMDQAARLHGPRWGDATLEDHDWLAAGVANGTSVGDLYAFCWDGFLERYEPRLEPHALEVGRVLRERVKDWTAHRPPTLTLTHGDYRLDNMLFAPSLVVRRSNSGSARRAGGVAGKDRRRSLSPHIAAAPEAMEEDAASGVIRPSRRADHLGDAPLEAARPAPVGESGSAAVCTQEERRRASAEHRTEEDGRLDEPISLRRQLVVVDWQTVRLGCGTADVAYFLGAGLDVATRRAHEQELVARYHQALGAYAVDYTFDECWTDYRRYSYGGYVMAVIASVLVGRTERGDDMFMAMANRHATQAVDLDAEELI